MAQSVSNIAVYTDSSQIKYAFRFMCEIACAFVRVILRDLTNWNGEVWTLNNNMYVNSLKENNDQMTVKYNTPDFKEEVVEVKLIQKESNEDTRSEELVDEDTLSNISEDLLSEQLLMSVQTESTSDWLYKAESQYTESVF